jgi:hypothetical protein
MELQSVEKKLRVIYDCYPDLRNARDANLTLVWWKIIDGWEPLRPIPVPELMQERELTNPDTIRRVRQKLQARGEYLPTDLKVVAARDRRREEFQRFFEPSRKCQECD